MSRFNPNGIVVYEGPSRILPSVRVAVVVTGITDPSDNVATGPMVQVWYLVADEAPADTMRSDSDAAVCGGCPLRGFTINGKRAGRACYVNLGQAPRGIWQAYRAGRYRKLSPEAAGRLLVGREVRLGAYGDPTSAPLAVSRALVAHAKGWTGYTHQWRSKRLSRGFRKLCQASVETLDGAREARRRGWGTFLALPVGAPIPTGWSHCAKEASPGVQCITCLRCDGRSRNHEAIRAHGAGAKYVTGQRRHNSGAIA